VELNEYIEVVKIARLNAQNTQIRKDIEGLSMLVSTYVTFDLQFKHTECNSPTKTQNIVKMNFVLN